MFREMRRKNQLLSDEDVKSILEKHNYGVLSIIGDEGRPYAVPISYVYYDNKLFFHSAKSGHKIDAIRNNDKASFVIVDENQIVPEEYTTYFRSVIAFGNVRIIDDNEEKFESLYALAEKFGPNDREKHMKEINKSISALLMLEFNIEHITGKEAIEFVRMKKK